MNSPAKTKIALRRPAQFGGAVRPSSIPISAQLFFFFNDTATTEIYTLSLHDALPIFPPASDGASAVSATMLSQSPRLDRDSAIQSRRKDRKSTRLNSSNMSISYA